MSRDLLMIPGPVEVSAQVEAAYSVAPPSHVSAAVIEAFGSALDRMPGIWAAGENAQPFVVAGSGTLAMESAVWNVVEPGDVALVIDTGYFSKRMAEILRRAGAEVEFLSAEVGHAPSAQALAEKLEGLSRLDVVTITHVDTSTGVCADVRGYTRVLEESGREALVVVDGVCAAAAEQMEMERWGVDVYLTGSQKAIGLPGGLALWVASQAAMAKRAGLEREPALYLDWSSWTPIMAAYRAREASYFATPATNLILALEVALAQIDEAKVGGKTGIAAVVERHRRVAKGMRQSWEAMGLASMVEDRGLYANTMSALLYPEGVDGAALRAAIREEGVIVAGGLLPEHKHRYFRVGHMGDVTTRPEALERCVRAIARGLVACGVDVDEEHAVGELSSYLYSWPQKGR